MKKFTLGAIAGASALALSVPIVLQLASAASSGTASSTGAKTRPVPSQACVQALAAKDDAFLKNIDSEIAAHKAAMLAHKNALVAAAGIADDTQRVAALKKAEEDLRTAMKAAMGSKTDMTATMDAIKAACGNAMGMGGMMGGPGGMRGPGGPDGRMHGGMMMKGGKDRGHFGGPWNMGVSSTSSPTTQQ